MSTHSSTMDGDLHALQEHLHRTEVHAESLAEQQRAREAELRAEVEAGLTAAEAELESLKDQMRSLDAHVARLAKRARGLHAANERAEALGRVGAQASAVWNWALRMTLISAAVVGVLNLHAWHRSIPLTLLALASLPAGLLVAWWTGRRP